MKRLLSFFCMACLAILASAQSYTISGAGTGKSGHYLVAVKVNVKKTNMKSEDIVLQAAVDGVLFRGFMTTDGAVDQKPLVEDPGVQTAKADFFELFNENNEYRRYATIVPTTLTVMKNKKLKCTEVSAQVLVNHETLRAYLEKSGIIAGFSNLW